MKSNIICESYVCSEHWAQKSLKSWRKLWEPTEAARIAPRRGVEETCWCSCGVPLIRGGMDRQTLIFLWNPAGSSNNVVVSERWQHLRLVSVRLLLGLANS